MLYGLPPPELLSSDNAQFLGHLLVTVKSALGRQQKLLMLILLLMLKNVFKKNIIQNSKRFLKITTKKSYIKLWKVVRYQYMVLFKSQLSLKKLYSTQIGYRKWI